MTDEIDFVQVTTTIATTANEHIRQLDNVSGAKLLRIRMIEPSVASIYYNALIDKDEKRVPALLTLKVDINTKVAELLSFELS